MRTTDGKPSIASGNAATINRSEGGLMQNTIEMQAQMSEESTDLNKYIELVDVCARERIDFRIPNGSPKHARVLISKLFETARQEVLLVSGRLTDITEKNESDPDMSEVEIYGHAPLINNARSFLKRSGSTLRIIVMQPVHLGNANRFLKGLINDPERQGEVSLYNADSDTVATKPPHFVVTDALAFRYETDDENVVAVANFGDGKTAKALQTAFRDLATRLTGLQLIRRFQPGVAF